MLEYKNKIIDFYIDTFENSISEAEREVFLKDEYGLKNEEEFMCLLVNNFIMVQSEIMKDLKEINDRIKQIDKKRSKLTPEDYEFKKLDNCKRINIKAKEEIEHFFTEKTISYIKERVADRKRWIRSTGELNSIFDKLPYNYSYYKQFYSPEYDYSTDTKYRFILNHSPSKIKEKIDQKLACKERYYADLDFIMKNENMLKKVLDGIRNHHVLIKREEIFDTLIALYEAERYQSFINLAVLQVEGLFYDFCFILNDEVEVKNIGTLSVKAEKAFVNNPALWLSTYPYYAFDAPIFRNKIAHNGLWDSQDLKNFCNELVFDLYSIIQAIKIFNKLPYNLLGVVLTMRKEINTVEIPEEKYPFVLAELFGGSQLGKFGANGIFSIIKNREKKKEVLEFYTLKVNDTEHTSLYEECCRLTDVIYCEKTWDIIIEHLKEISNYQPGKPYDFVEFATSIKNSYINEFSNGSILKEKCIEVSKALKKFKNA